MVLILHTYFSRFTFRRNLFTNLLLVLVLAILVRVLFGRMYTFYREQEMSQRQNVLQTELNHITKELDNLGSLLTQTKYSDFSQRVNLIKDEIYPSDYIAIRDAQYYLLAITAANSTMADIVIYFSNSGIVLTSNHSYVSQESFLRQYKGIEIDTQAFVQRPSTRNAAYAYMAGGKVQAPGQQATEIAFISRIPLGSTSIIRPRSYAYLLVSKDALLDGLLTEGMRAYGSLELLDGEGRPLCIYSAQEDFVTEGSVVSITNEANTLKVNAYLPEHYFGITLKTVSDFVNLSIVAVFIIGVVAAFMAAWQQSMPMRRLLASFAKEGLGEPAHRDEYVWLQESMRHMNEERRDITVQLDTHRKLVQMNSLERLLTGASMTREQQERAHSSLANMPRPFMVGYAKLLFASKLDSSEAEDIRAVVIMEHLQNALPPQSIMYSFDADTLALLVPCLQDSGQIAAAVRANLSRVNSLGKNRIEIIFSVPISDVGEIALAYDQIRARYTPNSQDCCVVCCTQELEESSPYSVRGLHQLYDYINIYDVQAATSLLESLIYSPYFQGESLRQRFFMLRGILLLSAANTHIESDAVRNLRYQPADNLQTMMEKMSAAVTDLCQQVMVRKNTHHDKRTQAILDYMNKNFQDSHCCPSVLAAAFSITEKHLYTLLKEKADTTPAAYLQELRLKKAASLIETTMESTQQVSMECGFINFNTFYKAFKRAYGVTPTQYRDRQINE